MPDLTLTRNAALNIAQVKKQVLEALRRSEALQQLNVLISQNEQSQNKQQLLSASANIPYDLVRIADGSQYYLLTGIDLKQDQHAHTQLAFILNYDQAQQALAMTAEGQVVLQAQALRIWGDGQTSAAQIVQNFQLQHGMVLYKQLYQVGAPLILKEQGQFMQPVPLFNGGIDDWLRLRYPDEPPHQSAELSASSSSSSSSSPNSSSSVSPAENTTPVVANATAAQSPTSGWGATLGSVFTAVTAAVTRRHASDATAAAGSPTVVIAPDASPRLREALQVVIAMLETVEDFHHGRYCQHRSEVKVPYILKAISSDKFSYDPQYQAAYIRDLDFATPMPSTANDAWSLAGAIEFMAPEELLQTMRTVRPDGKAWISAKTDYYGLAAVAAEILGCPKEMLLASKWQAQDNAKPVAGESQAAAESKACVKTPYNFNFPEVVKLLLAGAFTNEPQAATNYTKLVALLKALSAAELTQRPESLRPVIKDLQQIQLNLLVGELEQALTSAIALQLASELSKVVDKNQRNLFARCAPLSLPVADLLGKLAQIPGLIKSAVADCIRRNEQLFNEIHRVANDGALANTILSRQQRQNLDELAGLLGEDDDAPAAALSLPGVASNDDEELGQHGASSGNYDDQIEEFFQEPGKILRATMANNQQQAVPQVWAASAVVLHSPAAQHSASFSTKAPSRGVSDDARATLLDQEINALIGKVVAEIARLQAPDLTAQAAEHTRKFLRGTLKLFSQGDRVPSTADTQQAKAEKVAVLTNAVSKMRERKELTVEEIQAARQLIGIGAVMKQEGPSCISNSIVANSGRFLDIYNEKMRELNILRPQQQVLANSGSGAELSATATGSRVFRMVL